MQSETRQCQNCEKSFIIEPDDFGFYQKMQVPLPQWCPDCQFVRRMVFRNQNNLYHRTNNAPESDRKIISIYSDEKEMTIYDRNYWWSDKWDAYSYGKEYDFLKPFFEQLRELIKTVPWPSLFNWNAVNSDYCNLTTDNKNCYLVFGGDYNENCSYSTFNFHSRDSQDLYLVERCEFSYECTDCQECYKALFCQRSKSCSDSMFLYDCINCTNCVGCVNLRNRSFSIFNEQYSQDEYASKMKDLKLDTREGLERMAKKFQEFKLRHPHRFAHILKSENCTGDNIVSSKNCINCFDLLSDSKDLKNVFLSGSGLEDGRNMSHAGHGVELVYDSFAIFGGCRNVRFSTLLSACIDATYSCHSHSSSNIFGCVGIRDGNYVILNKKYTKEEYNKMIPRIIEHMDAMPYVDKKGMRYGFGEFLPAELSPFGYNETIAYDYYPLSKDEAERKGFNWKAKEGKDYKPTITCDQLPSSIDKVSDDILDEVIECFHKGDCEDQCTRAFKIIQQELQLYKRLKMPIPNLCPNCRHYKRVRSRNPMKLWHRKCMNEGCKNEFETSYAPDRPETVYCESCYQKEVY